MGKVDENEMKSNRKILRVLAALLTLLLLCGCGAPAPAPAATEAAPAAKEDAGMTEGTQITVETPEDDSSPEEPGLIRVSTVDEFLAAIRPNATIELAAGEYDLSTASDYGLPTENPNYRWNLDPSYDGEGYELEILNVEDLSIRGAGREDTSIAAVPRYVNVIRFTGCPDLEIRDLTAGHTREAGICSGGVLYFERCSGVTVDGCGLYGCGTVGVWAVNCDELSVTGSHIYECSSSAVEVTNCRDVRVDGCEIYRMGRIQDWPAYALFAAHETDGFAAANCRIYDNDASILLLSDRTRNCLFLSNLLESNELDHAIEAYRYCPVVDGCLFADQAQISSWYAGTGTLAVDRSGNMLDDAAFSAMRYEKLSPDDVRLPEGLTEEAEPTAVPAGGTVTVTTADELLAAIGPDRTIVLDGADFALTKAENYGGIGTRYCYWSEVYDGQELVIDSVDGLTIRAASDSPESTQVTVEPRYANVFRFVNCRSLHLQGFTAGHSRGMGECAGGVLYFEDCRDVWVDSCRLYGCGILGIWSNGGSDLIVDSCEIYECSQGGVWLDGTVSVSFTNCNIHDVPSPALSFRGCGGVVWNWDSYCDGSWDPDGRGALVSPAPVYYDEGPVEPEEPIAEEIWVIYQNRTVDELILKTGDSVILQADGSFLSGDGSRAKYSWLSEDPAVLSAKAGRDSHQCVVKVLGEAPDGVLLTVDCGGVQHQVRVYCVGN